MAPNGSDVPIANTVDGLARYTYQGGGPADGALYFNVLDLAKWDAALYTEKLLKHSSLDLMWTPAKLKSGQPNKDGYGFGWVIDKERHIVSHSGRWDGTATYFLLDLEKGFTVAVLSNDENTDTSSLAEEILKLFMKSGE